MKIKIFTTGGTIDKIYFDQKDTYKVGDPQAENLLERANVSLDYEIKSILKKDSLELTDKDRELIYKNIKSEKINNIVITHGTDTMIKTAKILKDIKDKTIVLTGSMYPAKFKDSDAIFNMGFALGVAQSLNHGVYIAMNGTIFDPLKTRKNVKLNRFEVIK